MKTEECLSVSAKSIMQTGAPMRILYAISDRNIGGAGIQLLNLLRHLDRSRCSVAVALPFRSRLRERLLAMRIRVYELREPCERLTVRSVGELLTVIGREQPQILHANGAIAARVAGRLAGVRVVFTRHCAYPKAANATPICARLANRFLCDCAIATASAAARDLLAMGIPAERIRVIPNGSDPVRAVDETELNEWRARLRVEPPDFCVGICARLEPCKGHDIFLRAAKLARSRMPHRRFRFLIIGEGSRRGELERLTEALGLQDDVRFTGFLSDVAPLYRLMRLHINSSRGTETSCLAISEAMSAGVPCIVSDYGGNRDMIGTSHAGLVFPCGDAEALADCICRVAADAALEATMRRAALARHVERFTAVRMAERTVEVYRSQL